MNWTDEIISVSEAPVQRMKKHIQQNRRKQLQVTSKKALIYPGYIGSSKNNTQVGCRVTAQGRSAVPS